MELTAQWKQAWDNLNKSNRFSFIPLNALKALLEEYQKLEPK